MMIPLSQYIGLAGQRLMHVTFISANGKMENLLALENLFIGSQRNRYKNTFQGTFEAIVIFINTYFMGIHGNTSSNTQIDLSIGILAFTQDQDFSTTI